MSQSPLPSVGSDVRVSVIIVVKNDLGVARTLELVATQSLQSNFEIIVIDASLPHVLADVRQAHPEVRWVQYDQGGKRFTITEQRNLGINLARGEAIVFIDASCEPAAGWLDALVEAIDEGEDIVTGPCRASNPHNMVAYIAEHQARTYVPECTTINVAFRRSVLARVGDFDTSLDYGEDVDFFWRCVDAGFKICFEPAAQISHDYGEGAEQRRRAYRYGKSRAIIHAKHWRTRHTRLFRDEPHVWMYALFLATLPIALVWPYYVLLLLVPMIKNRSISVVAHHLIFGAGVLVGAAHALRVQSPRQLRPQL